MPEYGSLSSNAASNVLHADKAMIDNQIKTIRNQYGKLITKTKVEDNYEVTGTFFCESNFVRCGLCLPGNSRASLLIND